MFKAKIFAVAPAVVLLLCLTSVISHAQVNSKLVKGGQFKDLILPMPINNKLTEINIWGTDSVKPRDVSNGIEGSKWCYWGGNPVKGNDGNYHIAICRWREETGHWGWPKSEVAHTVSKNVVGPYNVTETILPKGHNPEVVCLNNGSYVLHVSGGDVYTSQELTGPWNHLGKIKIDTRGYKGLSHLYTNLTGLERKDGSFLFFTKRGDVMISDTGLLGPYKIVSAHNYDRYSGYPEDPVIWKSRHQYHVVFNHAVDKKSVYMRSIDGIHWRTEPGEPYDSSIFRYTDGTINRWCKFERPKVVQDEYGRATHLSLAVIDVEKKLDLGNDNHSSKNVILPLVKESLIEILNTERITSNTKELKVKIKAEVDFNPINDVDVESLRIGASGVVNHGGGEKAVHSEVIDGDMLITFNCDKLELTNADYDLKLLGKRTDGNLIYGYALLPAYPEDPASLVTVPIKINDNKLITAVENFGLRNSVPCKLEIFYSSAQKRKKMKVIDIPMLKPYESFDIELPIKDEDESRYEAIFVGSEENTAIWHKVDDTHLSIEYKGNWNINESGSDIYLGTEKTATDEGASATFIFTGTQARCYGHIGKPMGSFNVYIDDEFIERVDCFFGVDLYDVVIYQTQILPQGQHKLEMRATGKHYKGNPTAPVSIDAFSYINQSIE